MISKFNILILYFFSGKKDRVVHNVGDDVVKYVYFEIIIIFMKELSYNVSY